MQPGDLIEIPGDGEPLVALVVERGPKKVRLVTEQGRELVLAPGRSWCALGSARVPSDIERAAGTARRIAEEIRRLQEGVDLEALWDLLVDDGRRYPARELAELALEHDDPLSLAALRRAIEQDRLLFRSKKELFEPVARKLVQELGRQRLLAEERARVQARGIEALRRALASGDTTLADGQEPLLDLLEAQALHLDFPRARAAAELLEALGSPGGKEPHIKAFDLLVRLGRFDPDENLHLRQAQVPVSFSAKLLEQAEELAASSPWEDPQRVDLRELFTVSIDDPDTTEVDDALSAARGPGGGWRVWVHIADPGALVPFGSDLMEEAARRACTLYLPEGKITMFPEVLAEGPLSLTRGKDRASLSLEVDLGSDGQVLSQRFLVSRVRVDRHLSYEDADEMLEQSGEPGDLLQHLVNAADALETLRRSQGAMLLNGPEVKVRRSPDGRIRIIPVDHLSPCRSMVAEMMILTGSCAARFFVSRSIPASYRRQEPPEQEIVIPDGPLAPAAFYAAVRKLKRAEIGRIPGRHAGLGVEPYVQISSPIRRYGDLLLQAQLKSSLLEGEPRFNEEELLNALGQTELTVETLNHVERESRRYWTLRYLQGFEGQKLGAVLLEERRPGHYQLELGDVCLRANMDGPVGLAPGQVVEVLVGPVDPRRDRISLRFSGLTEE